MMPYFPNQTQNRVENIKKKFEIASISDDDRGKMLNNAKSVTLPSKTRLLKYDECSNRNNKNSETDSTLEKTEMNRSDGKVLIRRSPAFRCDKIVCGRNVTNVGTKQKPTSPGNKIGTVKDFNGQKLEKRIKDLKTTNNMELNSDQKWNNFRRSNTDSNLLKHNEDNSKNDINSVKSTLISKQSNLLAKNDNNSSANEVNDKILAQYSVVNKNSKKCNEELKEQTNDLHLSESIRLALNSPLPKGPPPKKPPRTFLHTHAVLNASKSLSDVKIPKTGDEDPKLKSKLEKLEKVIKNHEIGSHISVPNRQNFKAELERKLVKMPDTNETRALPDSPNEKREFQSCLNCVSVNECTNPHVYEKLIEKKSEFYIDVLEKSDLKLNCDTKELNKELNRSFILNEKSSSEKMSNHSNPEPIYDLPYIGKGTYFETFGKSEEPKTTKDPELHYMCTDLVRSLAESRNLDTPPKVPSPIGNSPGCGRNLSQDMLDCISKFETKIDKVAERPGSLKIGKESGGKEDIKVIMNQAFGSPIQQSERKQSNASNLSDSDSTSTSSTPDDPAGSPLSEHLTRATSVNSESKSERSNLAKEEILSQMTAKRKVYVKRVSSRLFSPGSYLKPVNRNNSTHLFECCLLVGLTLCETKRKVPYVKNVFPTHVTPPPLIESLCFPDASDWPPSSDNQRPDEQYYSLVITNENGDRKFGYCRRVLPEGGHFCLPLVYCIVSHHRANGFYYKILQELESRHGSPDLECFIKQLYESEFPGPGQSLKLTKILENATRTSPLKTEETIQSTLVRRPCDIRLEEKDLSQLLEHLDVSVFLKVFSSLLHERKVLLLSHSLRKLSSCIEALQSILFPFSWQHTYIPVLPDHLIEMCDAPTPYVMGLIKSKSTAEPWSNIMFEDGIMVDLEESRILKCCGDEGSILPPRFTKALKTALNLAVTATHQSDNNRNVLISEAFVRFFVEVCGHYSNFFVAQPDGKNVFEKDKFIKSLPSKTTQSFLEWFTDTTMFQSFIQERLQFDTEDLFKRRAMEHSSEMEKNTAMLLKNYKVVNRKARTFGDKIKDLTIFSK